MLAVKFSDNYFRIPGLFQELCLFPGLSARRNVCNILMSELSMVRMNRVTTSGLMCRFVTVGRSVCVSGGVEVVVADDAAGICPSSATYKQHTYTCKPQPFLANASRFSAKPSPADSHWLSRRKTRKPMAFH